MFEFFCFFADSISGTLEFSSSRFLVMNCLGLFKINSNIMFSLRLFEYLQRCEPFINKMRVKL